MKLFVMLKYKFYLPADTCFISFWEEFANFKQNCVSPSPKSLEPRTSGQALESRQTPTCNA